MNYGPATERKIKSVLNTCEAHGHKSIIALAGVPGTGKSYIASIAAQRFANEPLFVKEVQFHQSFSYEEFIEGMRIDSGGSVAVKPGIFLEWNEQARDDPDHRYVLLIEELTRANLPAVLGELMTYLEYRDRPFVSMYSRRSIFIAKNLTVIATYNPADRSAIEVDNALLRRMRIITFLPSVEQLVEMLEGRGIRSAVIEKLKHLFESCKTRHPDEYEFLMPFGHGMFADIQKEQPDLHQLWVERISHMLRRPLMEPDPFTDVIEQCFPWRDPGYSAP